jgi:glycosyltransferase involved in cell wall biosynthesis
VDLSVVIPAYNEQDSLDSLVGEIDDACGPLGLEYEILIVDDGSTDGTVDAIERLARTNPRVWGIRLRRNFGKSEALAVGIGQTVSELVITLDADGQDNPADIPRMLDELDAGLDLVSGWKVNRRDPLTRRVASRIFNKATAWTTGVDMADMNCGFKAYRGDCARSLDIYGEMHRYLPVLAHQEGWRVGEIPVDHRAREHGRSKFGLERYPRGALDLLTVIFLGRYQSRPLHLFGGTGAVLAIVGVMISLYLAILRLSGDAIGGRPLLILGVLFIVVGVQLISLGLLAQLMVSQGRERVADSERIARMILGNSPSPAGATPDSERSPRVSNV